MKKTIIAGAAATVLAAMPVMGAFAATNSLTDTLSIGVADVCELGANSDDTVAGKSYTKTNVTPNTLVDFDGQSTVLNINCNNESGYKITPTFTGLTAAGIETGIIYSNTTAEAGSGTWTASYVKNSESSKNFTDNTAVTSDSGSMEDTYTITYKVGVGKNQSTGTYTGTAKYELAKNS